MKYKKLHAWKMDIVGHSPRQIPAYEVVDGEGVKALHNAGIRLVVHRCGGSGPYSKRYWVCSEFTTGVKIADGYDKQETHWGTNTTDRDYAVSQAMEKIKEAGIVRCRATFVKHGTINR